MGTIYAPFTEEQVESLNGWQVGGYGHPFTCGNDTCHHVSLIATKDGWICPNCHNWTQNWCHSCMADYSWKVVQDISLLDKNTNFGEWIPALESLINMLQKVPGSDPKTIKELQEQIFRIRTMRERR